jgi:hypothetical protein
LGLEPQTLLVSCVCAIALSSEICRAQSLRIGGAVCTVARRDALGQDNRVRRTVRLKLAGGYNSGS